MERIVTHPRLICGLLSELDAEKVVVIVRSQEDSSSSIYETLISFQSADRFKDSSFSFSSVGKRSDSLLCEAILEGWRISFFCKSVDSEGLVYGLPETIILNDFRGDKRIAFPNGEYPAEVRYPGGILIGFAYDISRDYISILVDIESFEISEYLECEVLVRKILGNMDVFYRKLTLFNKVKTPAGLKLVFSTKKNSKAQLTQRPRAQRYRIDNQRFSFRSESIGMEPISDVLLLTDISLTGFSALNEDRALERRLLKGLLLHSSDSEIGFYLVRNSKEKLGFKIHPGSIKKWIQFVAKLTNRTDLFEIRASDLSKLFTTSNYVKNARRKIYGKQVSPHVAHSGSTNQRICKRLALADLEGEITDHISAIRFSDHVWMLQEVVGGINANGNTLDLVTRFVENMKSHYQVEPDRARYLLCQYSENVPTIFRFWNEYGHDKANTLFKGFHIGGIAYSSGTTRTGLVLSDVQKLSHRKRKDISENFDSTFLEMFCYWNPSKNSQLLNIELSCLGDAHSTSLNLVTRNDEPKCLIYRINTYYSSNSTGMITGIYITFSQHASETDVKDLVAFLSSNKDLMSGTSDIVVFEHQHSQFVIKEIFENASDEFQCLLIDLELNTK